MVIKIIAGLADFTLSGQDEHILSRGVGISNHHQIKKQFFAEAPFLAAIGVLNQTMLQEINYFTCAIIKTNDDADACGEIDQFKRYLNDFLLCLWLIKDNSVHVPFIFSHVVNGTDHTFASFPSGQNICNSSGITESVSFSKEEMEDALSTYARYKDICEKGDVKETPGHDSEVVEAEKDSSAAGSHPEGQKLNRIVKAVRFLQAARVSAELPLRIAMYLPVFECLFGSGLHTDARSGIASRVAKYAGSSKAERMQISGHLKKACDVRRQFFYGDMPDAALGNAAALIDLSKEMDGIARKVLSRIIRGEEDVFLQDTEVLDNFFTALMFE